MDELEKENLTGKLRVTNIIEDATITMEPLTLRQKTTKYVIKGTLIKFFYFELKTVVTRK